MLRVSIVGASGYSGGELLRLLLFHPQVTVSQVTSQRYKGKAVSKAHPNLRKVTQLSFSDLADLEPCDVLFLCLPHGRASQDWDYYAGLAPRIIDLSADFRLSDPAQYQRFYRRDHPRPELLQRFTYGIAELHRNQLREAQAVACAGCNATASILGLYPLFKEGLVDTERTVLEVKVGSSEGGNQSGPASHHPERSGCLRSFSPVGHRHVAEMEQELGFGKPVSFHFSGTAVDMVRGVLATAHVFTNTSMEERDLWKLYRSYYGGEPFIRLVAERDGLYRFPEPKLVAGTHFCDIGFKKDPDSNRIVVFSAIDNLVRGSAGQAVHALNLMAGFPEETALTFPGLHPV